MIIITTVLCLVGVGSCRKIVRKPTKDPFHDFKDDPDLEIPEEDDDTPPTHFTGNVQKAQITNSENRNHGKGKFKYTFNTQNGISIAQVGKLKDNKTFVVMGSYAYTGADGKRYRVRYTADELGYHPITMLDDLDLPEINFTKPETKPLSLSRPTINFASPKIDLTKSNGQSNNLLSGNDKNPDPKDVDSKYQRETFHVNDDVKVKVTDVSNNSGGGNNNLLSDNGYNYEKPLVTTPEPETLQRTYLPPKQFIPPTNREYLPPTGFAPPKSEY
ncbi:Larval cuticle protein 9 [Pseudolycoriella hygida]|uniref:Larval cuticle protein 9 n=1 Tax=Pseudolycoriella hygida TaxID=35572 RepID=A0A9Q0RZS1_9DIPT|nr:Larval cuticle protein 9 [Pseudolycoriella hygida]